MEMRVTSEDYPYVSTAEYHKNRSRAPHLEQRGHRRRLLEAGYLAVQLALENECKTLVDLACGDGGLLQLIEKFYDKVWGYDFQPANVEAATTIRKQNVVFQNIVDEFNSLNLSADVAVMTECLEHLHNPHAYVKQLYDMSEIKFLIASSPVYETHEHHDSGHVWVWDMDGYANVIKQGGWNLKKHFAGGNFQLILGERP